jgi:hypothetical protein|tara:strand:- start:150 stop:290 length:141 start_codon:yes stop_codon:yes gene_type:complete
MMTDKQIRVLLQDLETVMDVGDRLEPNDITHAIKQAQIDILKWVLE